MASARALADGLVHEDHAAGAEALGAPGDAAAVVAVGGAGDGDGVGPHPCTCRSANSSAVAEFCHAAAGQLRLQQLHHRIGPAQRLEAAEAESAGPRPSSAPPPRGPPSPVPAAAAAGSAHSRARRRFPRWRGGSRPSGRTTTPGVPAWRLSSRRKDGGEWSWRRTMARLAPTGCRGASLRQAAAARKRENAMQITILGGGGFLGRKLAHRLAARRPAGRPPVTGLTLFDLWRRPGGAPFPVRCLGGDVADVAAVAAAVPPGTDVVVHLAAVVSAQAEADFDLGLRSTCMARWRCCRPAAPCRRRRGWSSPPRSRASAAGRRPGWRMMPASFPATATARRRRRPSCCCRMPPAGACSMR